MKQVELDRFGIKNSVNGKTVLRSSGITARYKTLKLAQAAADRLNKKWVGNDWTGPAKYEAFEVGV